MQAWLSGLHSQRCFRGLPPPSRFSGAAWPGQTPPNPACLPACDGLTCRLTGASSRCIRIMEHITQLARKETISSPPPPSQQHQQLRPVELRGGSLKVVIVGTSLRGFYHRELCCSLASRRTIAGTAGGIAAMAMWRSALLVTFMGLLIVSLHAEQRLGYSPGEIYPDAHRVLAASSNYYISYGSLNADRAPCPASSSGRSYYTTNCQSSGTPQPYVRSCSQITRCARG